MKLETFFEKFDQFADAPDAVAKMRELIRNFAVRGKLVSQDPNDEPAEEAIRRVPPQPRPARFDKKSNANIQGIAALSVGPTARTIPVGWSCVPLIQIARLESGHTPSRSRPDWWGGDVSWIGVVDARLHDGKTIFETLQHTNEEGLANSAARMLPTGTVCVSRTASVGYVTVMGKPMATSQDFVNWVPSEAVAADWLKLVFTSEKDALSRFSKGAVHQTIYYPEWLSMHTMLPPIAEQRRIVAKVDELMALCDRLEAQQQERETRHAALARASLSRFADAPTPANLQFLFHPSYAIPPADLRKSILTLAVQGKLVPQDPNDEPAEEILRATSALFVHLVAAKKLSSPKPLPPIEEEDVPFSLPSGWAWCRLGQIVHISSGDGLVAKDMNDGAIPVYGGNGVNGYHDVHNVAKRTLVIGRVGFYCGSIHVTPEKAWVTDNAFITTFDEEHIDMGFLSWLLKATDLRERDNATAQPVISGGKVYPTILALPPLPEQRRIVSKVEQLMALVDELDTQLATARTTGADLMEAVVAELTAAA